MVPEHCKKEQFNFFIPFTITELESTSLPSGSNGATGQCIVAPQLLDTNLLSAPKMRDGKVCYPRFQPAKFRNVYRFFKVAFQSCWL